MNPRPMQVRGGIDFHFAGRATMLQSMTSLRFSILPGEWAIARLPANAPVPEWADAPASFSTVTRTPEQLSVVCLAAKVPAGVRAERGWALLKLHGPFDFDETGILMAFAQPLAAAGIAILAISTFDTDYVLVKSAALDHAIHALTAAGHIQV